jgi:hypothetical protein
VNLREINDEEWCDVPYTIRLVGGEFDGKKITWECLPQIFRVPVPVNVITALYVPDPAEVPIPMHPEVVEYIRTGKVAEDGAHLYTMRNV